MNIKTCPNCKTAYEPVLGSRKTGNAIQVEFPNATPWEREQLITGICSEDCFDEYLGVRKGRNANGKIERSNV